MRLGFAINTVYNGVGSPLIFNRDNVWTSYIEDPRMLQNLWYNPNGERIEYFRFIEEGFFLVSIMPICGRPNDICAYYLFVPKDVIIEGEELLAVFRKFASADDKMDIMTQVATVDYPVRQHPIKYKMSPSVRKWAYRCYDNDIKLSEIIGRKRYQSYYDKFNAIFLVDSRSDIKPIENSVLVNLTDYNLVEMVTMMPPSKETLQRIFGISNITICYESKNGELKELPDLLIPKGEKLSLWATRKKFEPIRCIMVANNDYEEGILTVEGTRWYRNIKHDFFSVKDRNNPFSIVNDATIIINGCELGVQGLRMSEADCSCCTIRVVAPGFEQWPANIHPARFNIIKDDKYELYLMKTEKRSRTKSSFRNNIKHFFAGMFVVALVWALCGLLSFYKNKMSDADRNILVETISR